MFRYGPCCSARRIHSIVPLARLREPSFDRGAWNAGLAVSAPADGPASYEAFYALAENPFSQTSAPRFFYASPSHAHALEELRNAIRRRESLSVLAGEMGTGKTTLCRTILQQLPRKTVSAFVHDPAVSREDLLTILLVDFGVATVDEIARGRFQGATRTELNYLLRDFLGSLRRTRHSRSCSWRRRKTCPRLRSRNCASWPTATASSSWCSSDSRSSGPGSGCRRCVNSNSASINRIVVAPVTCQLFGIALTAATFPVPGLALVAPQVRRGSMAFLKPRAVLCAVRLRNRSGMISTAT